LLLLNIATQPSKAKRGDPILVPGGAVSGLITGPGSGACRHSAGMHSGLDTCALKPSWTAGDPCVHRRRARLCRTPLQLNTSGSVWLANGWGAGK